MGWLGGGGGGGEVPESESERALANIAREKWERFKSKAIPLENAYIARLRRMGSDAERRAMAGRGAATAQMSATPVTAALRSYNPGNGRFIGERMAAGAEMGMARTGAAVSADQASEARGEAGQMQLLRMGRNLDQMAIGNLSRQGSLETSRAIADAFAQQEEREAKSEAIGTAIGIGTMGYMNRPTRHRPTTYSARDLGLSDVPYNIQY